jgi:hypothetical protein
MGVSIHYFGWIEDEANFGRLTTLATDLAHKLRWPFEKAPELIRERSIGFTIYPHPDCEPLHFEFDQRWEVADFVKTQFAGSAVHIQIVEFLAKIQPLFTVLTVQDDGEYWETRDREKLEWHMGQVNRMIWEAEQADPSVQTQVRISGGRILDIVE